MVLGPLRSEKVGILLSAMCCSVPSKEQNRDLHLFKTSKQVFCTLISQLISTLSVTAG